MQYQSPIRFLDYAAIGYDQEGLTQISRIKKQITAEFALQSDGIIVIDTVSYTKHELLLELEHPDFLQRMQYHELLWQHKGLLLLLEKDIVDMDKIATWQPLLRNPGFVAFISPYFAPAFDSVMKTLLRKNNLYTASVWFDYFPLVQPFDEETALKNTRLYLDQSIKLFRNMNDQSYRQRLPELAPWYTESWSVFMNKMPQSLLYYTDDIANAIINFTVRIQKSDRKMCYQISSELAKLEGVNYSLKQLIESNHQIYKKNYESRTIKGRLRSIPTGYIIVVVLIALVRIFSLMDSGDKRNETGLRNAQPGNTTYADLVEKNKYQHIRDFYNQEYTNHMQAKPMNVILGQTPFAAQNTYIVIENSKDVTGSFYPFAFRNNTNKNIEINMMRGGSVYYLDARSHEVVSFLPKENDNVDMILSFGKEGKWSEGNGGDTNELQYIHIAPKTSAAKHTIDFTKEYPIELPYLDKAQLDAIPLMIIIEEKNDLYYYQIKGKAEVINFKPLPRLAKRSIRSYL